jgi:hypothetical protein
MSTIDDIQARLKRAQDARPKLTKLSFPRVFKVGTKWSRINHRFPQKCSLPSRDHVEGSGITEAVVIALPGKPVLLEVDSVEKNNVAFIFSTYPEAPMSNLSHQDGFEERYIPGGTGGVVEISDARGPILTYIKIP